MPLLAGKVDLGHVRFSREYDLAMWYVGKTPEEAESWVESRAPGPVQSARLHHPLLLRRHDRVLPSGCPAYKFMERCRLNLAGIGMHAAWDQNKFDRNARHHFGVFASCHHRELTGFDSFRAPIVYLSVPVWFQCQYEVPFGFHPAGPETTVYFGSYL